MPQQPKLTIGMAVWDDPRMLWATIQSLRTLNDLRECEILVVDNTPANLPSVNQHKTFCEQWADGANRGDNLGCRYIHMPEPQGTTAPRQRIFDEARGKHVLVMDSHILLSFRAINRYLDYVDMRDTGDMYSGPLFFDNLGAFSSHCDYVWRSEMYGIWATAWRCHATIVSARDTNGLVTFHEMTEEGKPVTHCPYCERHFPTIPWAQHEAVLMQHGMIPCGLNPEDEPFEIPAMGLGLFGCRRDAFPGFAPGCIGFGGEECHIHTKVRRAGNKVICLPFMRWVHAWGRDGLRQFNVSRWNKCRNYVLWANHLGLSLDPVYDHFVKSGFVPQVEWDFLVADPVKNTFPPQSIIEQSCVGCGNREQPKEAKTLQDCADFVARTPRDIDKHVELITAIASRCSSVVAFTKRREWDAVLLAATEGEVHSWCTEKDQLHQVLQALAGDRYHLTYSDSIAVESCPDADMLVIDTVHARDRLILELDRFGPHIQKYILLRGTGAFGINSEIGGPGLTPGIQYWVRKHPEWVVYRSTDEQYGMLVLSRVPEDRPARPGMAKMVFNFAAHAAEHLVDGAQHVTEEQFEERLNICATCPARGGPQGEHCSKCGCLLVKKAAWKSSACDLGQWPAIS